MHLHVRLGSPVFAIEKVHLHVRFCSPVLQSQRCLYMCNFTVQFCNRKEAFTCAFGYQKGAILQSSFCNWEGAFTCTISQSSFCTQKGAFTCAIWQSSFCNRKSLKCDIMLWFISVFSICWKALKTQGKIALKNWKSKWTFRI